MNDKAPRDLIPRGFVIESLKENGLLSLIVLGYTAAAMVAAAFLGRFSAVDFNLYTLPLAVLVVGSVALLIVIYLCYVILVLRPERPVQLIFQHLRTELRWRERLWVGGPLVVILPLFFSIFTSLKNLIPVFNPYHWDAYWSNADRWLFFGHQPWSIFQFLLRWPDVVISINAAYNLWFFLIYALLLWQMFSLRDRRLRLQFFMSFVLCWMLLGTVLATILSSAGPCYYGRIVIGPDPYAGLMSALHGISQSRPLWALSTQQMLWRSYAENHLQLGSGISAMPSMHLANGLLFALLAWRRHRALGVLLYTYLAILFVGSILLAWHYAVDGIVALLGTVLIWKVCGATSRALIRSGSMAEPRLSSR